MATNAPTAGQPADHGTRRPARWQLALAAAAQLPLGLHRRPARRQRDPRRQRGDPGRVGGRVQPRPARPPARLGAALCQWRSLTPKRRGPGAGLQLCAAPQPGLRGRRDHPAAPARAVSQRRPVTGAAGLVVAGAGIARQPGRRPPHHARQGPRQGDAGQQLPGHRPALWWQWRHPRGPAVAAPHRHRHRHWPEAAPTAGEGRWAWWS